MNEEQEIWFDLLIYINKKTNIYVFVCNIYNSRNLFSVVYEVLDIHCVSYVCIQLLPKLKKKTEC
jgi:hypothetical protein